jgi:iron complex outermembrane receptor protein
MNLALSIGVSGEEPTNLIAWGFPILSHNSSTLDKVLSHEKVPMAFTDRILAAVAAAIGLVAVAAHAQEPNLHETAASGSQQPAENPQSLPIALTVLNGADLETRRITSLDGVAAATPGISYAPTLNSATTLSLSMRGQGQPNPGQITRDGAIGVYQDGFYIARAQAITFDLLDLDRVEVLRGPQGASYGRDTTGGVINLISKAPAGALRFDQSVDFGNRNSYRVLSSLDAPRWHDLSAKVMLLASSIDGYVKNLQANLHNYGEEKQRAARLQLRWDGLSRLRANYFLERSALDSTPAYDSNPSLNGQQVYFPYTYYANPAGPMNSTYRPVDLRLSPSNHTAQGLTLRWQATRASSIESLTGYRTFDSGEQQDYAEFAGFPQATEDLYQQRQFSQEVRLGGALFDEQVGYTAGVSYFKEHGSHTNYFGLLADGITIVRAVFADTRSRAAYAQIHWRPTFAARRLELTAAARYTKDSKDAERSASSNRAGSVESGAVNHLSYNRVNPALTVDYRWSDGISTYAKVSTAYQAGGALESAPVGQFSSNTFRPESVTTYEVGLKSSFLHDRLRADVAVFDSRYKDMQYALPVDAITDQAYDLQKATVRGVDLELAGAPLHDLALSAGVTYLHWTIDRADALAGSVFDPASGSRSPYFVGQNIRDVFALQYTPKYNFTLAGDYALLHLDRRDVALHLDYVYRGEMFSDPAAGPAVPGRHFDTIPAYGLLNGRVTLTQETDWSHHVKLSLWGRNILNRKYYRLATGVGAGVTSFDSSTGVATPSGYSARAGAWAEPATYGIAINYQY